MGTRLRAAALAISILIGGVLAFGATPEAGAILQQGADAKPRFHYFWLAQPAGNSAQLITLFCNDCGPDARTEASVPLLSVLRDTLGDDRRDNDRITYVWLLGLSRQNIGKQLLAGVPFFYWRVGDGSTHIDDNRPVKPLMDLTKPEQPMAVGVTRDILQWTVLDPLSMPVRATSRAYRTNEVGRERAHIEEAIEYLREAPKSDSGQGLTQAEAETVMARLALRESLLGGLVSERQARRVGERQLAEQETVRTRNWDLLRTFAEKSGLLFEPLNVSGTEGEYAILWFPADSGDAEPVNSSHAAVWKALNLRDPWTDERLREWEGPVFDRWVDGNGTLLPDGVSGVRRIKLIPLGAYSLSYPKFPLLVIDFRDTLHMRRNEMTQRTINELTSGVIGISHFTNWYYYAGAAVYDFVASRHGRGMDAALRLDSYSQFRTDLALDSAMDPALKTLLQRRMDSVSLNPLDSSPDHEIKVADAQYAALRNEVATGELGRRLDKTREAELADFGKSAQALTSQAFLHSASFGLISPRYRTDDDLLAELNRARRAQADLDLLRSAANAGPHPEIVYDPTRLRSAVQDLSEVLPGLQTKSVRLDAARTLQRLGDNTKDSELQADCSFGLAQLRDGANPGILAAPRTVETALRTSELPK